MNRFSDTIIAAQLLENKLCGNSVKLFFFRTWRSYLRSALLMAAALSLLWFIPIPRVFFYLSLGMCLGAWLRDFAWLRSSARSWPFFVKVIDWVKVEAAAKPPA